MLNNILTFLAIGAVVYFGIEWIWDDDEPTAPTEGGNQPVGTTAKVYRLLAIGAGVGAAVLLFTDNTLAGIAAGVIAWILFSFSKDALPKEAEELRHKQEVKTEQINYKATLIKERQIEDQTRRDIELSNEERLTRLQQTLTARKESASLAALAEVAKDQGLTLEDVSVVNREKYLSEIRLAEREGMIRQDIRRTKELTDIELEKRYKEIIQDLDAGDLLDLSDHQLIKKQTEYLEEMYRRRHELLHGPDPDDVKIYLLARYDKNIQHLEAKIDARQAGLLLPPNGQKTKRLTAKAEGGADYPAEIDPDDI